MGGTLVIFDCDGVLVDSEPLAARVLAEEVRGLGIAMDDNEAAEIFLGCSMPMVLDILEARLGAPVETGFLPRFLDRLHAGIRVDLAPVDGVRAAIAEIKTQAQVRAICVASNGEAETVLTSLEAVGLISDFAGRLYTARMVERAKPYPDLFLHAARDMGFEPADCIVVEDSSLGVEAAIAAKMRVFRYVPNAEPDILCDHVNSAAGAKNFINMNQLPKLIAAVCSDQCNQ